MSDQAGNGVVVSNHEHGPGVVSRCRFQRIEMLDRAPWPALNHLGVQAERGGKRYGSLTCAAQMRRDDSRHPGTAQNRCKVLGTLYPV